MYFSHGSRAARSALEKWFRTRKWVERGWNSFLEVLLNQLFQEKVERIIENF